MTTIEGLQISDELAVFLKTFCKNGEMDMLMNGIETISNVQDLITENVTDIEDDNDDRNKIHEYLTDLVIFKRSLKKLHKLLPTVKD